MTRLTARPGLVGAIFDPADYLSPPPAIWRAPDSSERQRREFDRLCARMVLSATTWPIAPFAWPVIWFGGWER